MTNKQKLLDYLKSHDLMVIATVGNSPSAATVYYGVDDNFNFYIVTSHKTEHGINISKNHKIACVVVDTNQPMYEVKHKIGVQLIGESEQIRDVKDMARAIKIWSKSKKDIVNKYMNNIGQNIWDSRPYVIKPKEIKWFNEKLYGEEGTEIFKF